MRTPGACAMRSFGAGGRPGSLTVPLARPARRLLEQQTQEPPLREPQQEQDRKPKQQCRLPRRPHAPSPEPASSRGRRACPRASRDGHDERSPGVPLAPLRRGRAAGTLSRKRRGGVRSRECEHPKPRSPRSETGEPIAMCVWRPISKTAATRLDGAFRRGWNGGRSRCPNRCRWRTRRPCRAGRCRGTPARVPISRRSGEPSN